MRVTKKFTFEAAHRLLNVPTGHKCGRLHGHSFCVEVSVSGPVGERSGMVVDFGDISAAWRPVCDVLDHCYLNDVPGLDNPTSENIARWIWDRLVSSLPGLCEIVVRETRTAAASYALDSIGRHERC